MIKQTERTLAIIPARGGSKGIKNKNLTKLKGKSLVQRAVTYAVSHPEIDDVVISTDSQRIREVALEFGAKCHSLRPPELSGDNANSLDVWRHELKQSKELFSCDFQRTVLLEPTSPLRNFEDLTKAQKILNQEDVEGVVSVSVTDSHYTPHKSLVRDKYGALAYFKEDGNKYSIRQKIPEIFHRNGLIYLFKTQSIFTCSDLLLCEVYPLISDRPVVNIDSEMDLNLAEFLIERNYAQLEV